MKEAVLVLSAHACDQNEAHFNREGRLLKILDKN
jgi:hypothetical protein